MIGGTTDESIIEGAKEDCQRAVGALEAMLSGQDYFGGSTVSLADFHVTPVIHYTSQIPEGQAILAKAPKLSGWFERMGQRDSVSSTVPVFD